MSDSNTNLSDRIPARQALSTVEMFSIDDFPAPSGGVITLVNNTRYMIKGPIITSNRFLIPDGGGVVLEGVHDAQNSLIYNGVGTLFTGGSPSTPINSLGLVRMALLNFNQQATIFDLVGGFTGPVIMQDCFMLNFKTIGNSNGFSTMEVDSTLILGFDNGITSNDAQVTLTAATLTQRSTATGTILKVDFPDTQLNVTTSLLTPSADGFVFDITLVLSIPGSIANNTYSGTSNQFFKKHELEDFSAITNSTTVANCTSVTDSAGDAVFNFAIPHGFVGNGGQVTHTGFTNPQFNGDFLVVFSTLNNYEITSLLGETPIPFAAEATPGTATEQYRVFTVTTTTGLAQGTPVQIKNTTQNNGNFIVRAVGGSIEFSVPADFTIDEAGKWTTDSLNETDPLLILANNGNQKDSKTIALGAVNANSQTTGIADGAYQDLDVTGFVPNIVTERFILTDAVKGIFTYIGATPFQGFLTGALGATTSPSTRNYRFAMSFNGGIPLFDPIGLTNITSVSDSSGTARFVHGVTVPALSVGSFATIAGFTGGNQRYNQTGLVTFANATNFEIDGIDFIATGTGDFFAGEANYIPMEVKTTKVVIPLLFSAQLRPGDTIQLKAAGDGTAQTLTVTDLGFGVF